MINVAIIPARGGSKGIPKKNIKLFCGKPLIAWSINSAKKSQFVHSVWVSSDDIEILDVAESFGAYPIKRPNDISGDFATSESAWLHAIEFIESKKITIDHVLGMQATSPIRETSDIDNGFNVFLDSNSDSLASVCELEDYFIWDIGVDGNPRSLNYDYKNRKRRQELNKTFLENGSFYIFKKSIIQKFNNRLGGKIKLFEMAKHKAPQIDCLDDWAFCEAIMRGYSLDKS